MSARSISYYEVFVCAYTIGSCSCTRE